MAYNAFFWKAIHYWKACKEYVLYRRRGGIKSFYENFEYLNDEMIKKSCKKEKKKMGQNCRMRWMLFLKMKKGSSQKVFLQELNGAFCKSTLLEKERKMNKFRSIFSFLLAIGIVSSLTGCVDQYLTSAILAGHDAAVERLVAQGADVNKGTVPPLYFAVVKKNMKIVRLLLDHGAEVNTETRNGGTPLIAATGTDQIDMVRILLKHGADPNQSGVYISGSLFNIKREPGTALEIAQKHGYSDILSLLESYQKKKGN